MTSIYLRAVVLLLLSIGGNLCVYSASEQKQIVDTGLPNLSDRPSSQDKSIDVFASALYWYTSETVDWAYIHTTDLNIGTSHYKVISFDWFPGFRAGLGYNMHHDQWDTQLTYTWFQAHATANHSGGGVTPGFFAARLSLLEPFETGKVNFNIHYNMFDWDLGRSFLISKSLSMRPLIGLKAGWINQKIHGEWTIPDFEGLHFLYSASEKVKNNFSGAGPKIGLDGKWILGNADRHVFSLIGNFSGAYMWGHWKLQDTFIDTFLTQTSTPMGSRNFGALMYQCLMGFGWDFNFDKNCSHFALKVGYELQDWLNHFQVFTNISGTTNADLTLQGLTADLRFDF